MRRQILEFIITCQRERNFPPTIREMVITSTEITGHRGQPH